MIKHNFPKHRKDKVKKFYLLTPKLSPVARQYHDGKQNACNNSFITHIKEADPKETPTPWRKSLNAGCTWKKTS